eukprot:NODE_8544_length_285_cov_267.148305_g7804_i0.p2 GENE.NODE_8544_length_285_cov_267.148305_g7804_i0~~NODE_8544_length_285_cov_267.148305_g7804_i0.p2  ORF type:complete len:51 (-),score=5.04 NODE_8544_length_285_cov_267.148305_g7804_i0:98-250(-)
MGEHTVECKAYGTHLPKTVMQTPCRVITGEPTYQQCSLILSLELTQLMQI